jgi:hypothetical protein
VNPFLPKLWPLIGAMLESLSHLSSTYDIHYTCFECIVFSWFGRKNHKIGLSNLVISKLDVLSQDEHLTLDVDV